MKKVKILILFFLGGAMIACSGRKSGEDTVVSDSVVVNLDEVASELADTITSESTELLNTAGEMGGDARKTVENAAEKAVGDAKAAAAAAKKAVNKAAVDAKTAATVDAKSAATEATGE